MDRFEELLAKYLDDTIAPAEERELANALPADPLAARQFLALYRQDLVLKQLHRPEQAAAIESIMADIRSEETSFVGSVMQRVREETPSRALTGLPGSLAVLKNLWRSWLVRTAGAALVLLAFYFLAFRPVTGKPVLLADRSSGVILERGGQTLPVSDGLQLEPNDVLALTGTNEVAITYSPEDTRLELRPDTTLKLLAWADGKRFDLRQGTLLASVARQPLFKPLLVRTPQAEARVLGTKFTLTTTNNATRLDVSEGKVRLTRTADGARADVAKDHYANAGANTELRSLPKTGGILREIWTRIPGEKVNDLLYHPDYPARPAVRDFVKAFAIDDVQTNDSGCRLIGYIHPPLTGKYTFWIAAADGMLWLSPNENPVEKVRIAQASGRDLSKPQSPPITLVAGHRYFIQAVAKTATGSNHLAVAWQPPGGERKVIPGEFLSPFTGNRRRSIDEDYPVIGR